MIGADEFKMGSGSSIFNRPVHRVVIGKPFAIGVTDVTFRSWRLCVSEKGCKHQVDGAGYDKDDDPVVNVSWLGCFVFMVSQAT